MKAALNAKLADTAKVVELEAVKDTIKKTTMIDKQAFADFVEKVSQPDYKARHEFIKVGEFPDYVMADSAVLSLQPLNNEIHVSDHQIRHAIRDAKADRGASLPLDIIKELPEKLEAAEFIYDLKHNNLMAVFDIGAGENIGKSVLAINFKKGKKFFNSIVTSGIVPIRALAIEIYRKIINDEKSL